MQTPLNNDFRDNQNDQHFVDKLDYQYDPNGNMTYDANKNIDVLYNLLDQPTKVTHDNYQINYRYTAAGTKLRTKELRNGQVETTTDYCQNIVYINNQLTYIVTEVGRIVIANDDCSYEYDITDHLGNVRLTFNNQGETVKEAHYYPYGMLMNGVSTINYQLSTMHSLYNGKELQQQTQFYDYGFRQQDPQLGRWHSIDKLAEMYPSVSGYAYVLNNPVNMYDIAGLLPQEPVRHDWGVSYAGNTNLVDFLHRGSRGGFNTGGSSQSGFTNMNAMELYEDYETAVKHGFRGSLIEYYYAARMPEVFGGQSLYLEEIGQVTVSLSGENTTVKKYKFTKASFLEIPDWLKEGLTYTDMSYTVASGTRGQYYRTKSGDFNPHYS